MSSVARQQPKDALPPALALAFAPLHKRAFGMAIGTAFGLSIALATVMFILRTPPGGPGLGLLVNYFKWYSVSWPGVLVGFFWGFVVGCVAGWFVAFCRNLVIAISIFVIRTKSQLQAQRDFLDHI